MGEKRKSSFRDHKFVFLCERAIYLHFKREKQKNKKRNESRKKEEK